MKEFVDEIKSNGFEIDIINVPKNSIIANYLLQDKMILFFDLENDYPLRNFLDYCYDEDLEAYSKQEIKYILLHRNPLGNNIKEITEYYIPQLKSIRNFENEIFRVTSNLSLYNKEKGYTDFSNSYHSLYREILINNGYNGKIKSGFIFRCSEKVNIVGFTYQNFFSNPQTPLELIIKYIIKCSIDTCAYSRQRIINPKDIIYEQLDEETKEKVKSIENQIQELKESGQLLYVLPVLKKLMNIETGDLNFDTVSNIFIDSEYRITLPYFNNLEVKMGNLTKAVYILFYENPKGIDLLELQNYKNQLQKIYFDISPLENLDKMNQSINEVLNINTKAIYTHISRIKSAFQKVMDYEVAKHYMITGSYFGGTLKYIPIIKPNMEEERNIFFGDAF